MTVHFSCMRITLICLIVLVICADGFRVSVHRNILRLSQPFLQAYPDNQTPSTQERKSVFDTNLFESITKIEGDEQILGASEASTVDWHQMAKFGALLILPVIAIMATGSVSSAFAASRTLSEAIPSTMQLFDPSKFQPVCPASDGFYQVMKSVANTLIGPENVIEYGPLVASVLLRVRLELCVFESFVYEAVVPFVQQKGLSWILPLHETLETLLAGTIFAVASNFILLGSTKIFTVLLIYFDALFGFPARLVGDLMAKWSKDKSTINKAGNVLKFAGDVFGTVRKSIEVIDTFVGRYLVFGTTAYIIFKVLHYKLFNDLF